MCRHTVEKIWIEGYPHYRCLKCNEIFPVYLDYGGYDHDGYIITYPNWNETLKELKAVEKI